MASVTDGEMTYEVWRAPLEDGNTCIYERAIGPDGDIRNGGAAACGVSGTSWGVTTDRTGPETHETKMQAVDADGRVIGNL